MDRYFSGNYRQCDNTYEGSWGMFYEYVDMG